MEYKNGNCTFKVSDEILFVDHSKNNRSGHLGHGMVEYEKGKIIDFYPNCSGEKWSGHNACGYAEYMKSDDAGKTWYGPFEYPFSKTLYDLNINVYSSCEKAVCAKNGNIIAFNFVCDLINNDDCGYEPFRIPSYSISKDGGTTWSKSFKFCNQRGRIYDARVFNGDIYVLINYSEDSVDKKKLTVYHIFKSEDDGETFFDVGPLPFNLDFTFCRYYGTMEVLDDGALIVYSYKDLYDEFHIDYVLSYDMGKTWSDLKTTYVAKRIRNPQLIKFKNSYFMFGRSGSRGAEEQMGHNVMYFSKDGINWDEGYYLKMRENGAGAYSNVIKIHDGDKERLLLQMSYAYERNRTNIYHWFIDCKEK